MKLYLCLHLCFVFLWLVESTNIKLDGQGYNDVLVAISPRIAEDQELLQNIKSIFTSASRVLFAATQRRFFFRSVTILVPEKWTSQQEYLPVNSLSFQEADVRVDLPNPMYGDGPYTLQPGLCGDKGQYIHLTPRYLKYLNGNSTSVFGDPGKTFVHEWSHFRWGVFDEFGIPSHPMYPVTYYDGKNVRPNICSNKEVIGYYWDMIADAPCDFLTNSKAPPPHCRFIPTMDSEATSSLSSFHFLDKVDSFCGSSSDHTHNYKTPNKHNDFCDGLSAWEVIQMSEDYKKSQSSQSDLNTTPTFQIVQKKETAFVLVLDISSSMRSKISNGQTRLKLLQDAATSWLKYELRLGNAVGIVTFSTTASIKQEIIRIMNEKDREKVIGNIPRWADGQTCIGCGLKRALEAFRKYSTMKGGIILLLTDGDENEKTKIANVTQDIVNAGVKVVTIAFTAQADPKIEKLADLTGGKSFFVGNKAEVVSLNSAFFESTTYQTTDEAVSVKIHEALHSGTALKYSGKFVIDGTIGNQTLMSIICQNPITSVIINGGGKTFTLQNAINTGNGWRFSFPFLEAAEYQYDITSESSQNILVTVTSQSKNTSVEPIITRCWMELRKLPNGMEPMVIYADVKQGHSPVLNAKVLAKVDRPEGLTPVFAQLYDNGNGAPDTTADDGIYSRYFTALEKKGRYSVQAEVTSDGKSVIQDVGFTASRSMPAANKYPLPNLKDAPLRPTGAFERVVLAGAVNIENVIDNTDVLPPSSVRDLQILKSEDGSSSVTLRWTSPGDDLDEGTVSSYDVRISTTFEDVRFNFTSCHKIDTSKLTPLPAGKNVDFNFEIPDFQLATTYYVALKSQDKAGQISKLSNIVQVHIASKEEVITTSTEVAETTPVAKVKDTTTDSHVSNAAEVENTSGAEVEQTSNTSVLEDTTITGIDDITNTADVENTSVTGNDRDSSASEAEVAGNNTWIFVLVGVLAGVLIIAIVGFIFYKKKKNNGMIL